MNINKVIIESIFVGAMFNIAYNQIPEHIPFRVPMTGAILYILMRFFRLDARYCSRAHPCPTQKAVP